MFYYPSDREGLAWLEASDESWAGRAGAAYDSAVQRGSEDDEPEDAVS